MAAVQETIDQVKLIDVTEYKSPVDKTTSKAEKKMAQQLVESMSVKWDPTQYQDDYRLSVEKMIEEKIEHGDKQLPAPRRVKPAKTMDLAAMLQQSIRASRGGHASTAHNGHNGHARSKRLRHAK